MKHALTTLVVCSVLAGGAMADSNTDLYLQLKKNGEEIPQWLFDLENPRTPADNSRTGGGEDFSTAEPIASLPFSDTGTTAGKTGDITLSCASNGLDVVYSYLATADLCANVSLCGSSFDTVLGVFENTTQIACNDDNGPLCSGSRSSLANVPFLAGNVYYIVVDTYGSGLGGNFTLSVTECPPPPTPPVNDLPANALPISVGDCVTGSTALAVDNTGAYADTTHLNCNWKNANSTFYSNASSGSSKDVFYSITVPTGNYSFDLGGSGYDTAIGVWDSNNVLVAGNDDWVPYNNLRSKIECCRLTAGTYLISVDGYGTASGEYNLCVTACPSADTEDLPVAFELGKAFPNPFNPSTTINFTMGETAQANLTVYNMNGQAVATLVDGVVSAGAQSVVFDASELTSGVYFYTLNVAGQTMTEKMVLVK